MRSFLSSRSQPTAARKVFSAGLIPLALASALTLAATDQPYDLSGNDTPTFLIVHAAFQQIALLDTPHRRTTLEERLGVTEETAAYEILASTAHLAKRIQMRPIDPSTASTREAREQQQTDNARRFAEELGAHYGQLLAELDQAQFPLKNLDEFLREMRKSSGLSSSGPDGLREVVVYDVLFRAAVAEHFTGAIPEGFQ